MFLEGCNWVFAPRVDVVKALGEVLPVGRRRLEPLGILVFSVIMIISFVQILQESFTKLVSRGPHEPATLPAVAIGSMAARLD